MNAKRNRRPISRLLMPRCRRFDARRRAASFDLAILEGRTLLSGILVTGSGRGAPAEVAAFDSTTFGKIAQFDPYGSAFRGGVRVAVGDVLGNGSQVIVT